MAVRRGPITYEIGPAYCPRTQIWRRIRPMTKQPEQPETAPSDQFRERLLDAMLEIAPESGWTIAAMDRAAQKAGLSEGQVLLATPHGVTDLLDALGRRAAKAAGERLRADDIPGLKVRERVRVGVKAWLGALQPHKAAVKRAAGTPANLLTGPKGLWAAADAIWSALGDKSTDFNWYTKRTTLSAVLGSTLAAWVGTDDEAEIDAFLDRRIENVMQFEKLKGQVKDAMAKAPNPMDFFGQRKG
jgi:ubiquinone biosynthesis protein COQ9